ncbi:hypothetical protein ZWY2020_025881 [Hordeum vulgare]|nr:hypothetical protein ZWY2020_025881 [Hordeum vulgare]
MDDPGSEIEYEIPAVVRVHKSSRVVRRQHRHRASLPCGDPANGVSSKDVVLDPAANISARLYLPPPSRQAQKLPVVVFFHGGAFMIHTPASPLYHKNAASLAAAAPAVVVSVDYRLAPEHPVPAAYEDAFAALKAVVSSCRPGGAEPGSPRTATAPGPTWRTARPSGCGRNASRDTATRSAASRSCTPTGERTSRRGAHRRRPPRRH